MKPHLELDTPMTPRELQASLSLAAIYMLRMLGMFLILPVFSIFAREIHDSTPVMVGLAISAYGLTQAVFQIPFGLWSDRYGRKPIITLGLVIFVLGSAVAALSDSIYGIIAGRALQGAGAVAAVVMALAADLTREEHRTKAMALIGISIGLSFAISMVSGPILSNWFGLKGLFWVITGLAASSILVLHTLVPNPPKRLHQQTAATRRKGFIRVFKDGDLLRLDLGIFSLHLILTATFVVLPLVLRDSLQLETQIHWHIYLPVFVLAIISMVPFVILAEKKRKMKSVFLSFIAIIALADFGFAWIKESYWAVFGLLYVFFTGFNLLEATLPSMVSKTAPPELKGTAMGVYSTSQFLGAFIGGTGGGWIYGQWGIESVFIYCGITALVWLLVASSMKPPRHVSTAMIGIKTLSDQESHTLTKALHELPGIADAVVDFEEGVIYLKIEKEHLDRDRLEDTLRDYLKA